MRKLITGNLDERVALHPETGGWFLGCFMSEYPDFLSDAVELKWARVKKNEKKQGLRAITTAKTLVILISGEFLIRCPELNKEITLSKQGDFIFFDAGKMSHESRALKDSLLVVVRYPSARNG